MAEATRTDIDSPPNFTTGNLSMLSKKENKQTNKKDLDSPQTFADLLLSSAKLFNPTFYEQFPRKILEADRNRS